MSLKPSIEAFNIFEHSQGGPIWAIGLDLCLLISVFFFPGWVKSNDCDHFWLHAEFPKLILHCVWAP
jgi:hypothetical protein